jgi:hypothetical protein
MNNLEKMVSELGFSFQKKKIEFEAQAQNITVHQQGRLYAIENRIAFFKATASAASPDPTLSEMITKNFSFEARLIHREINIL